MSERAPAPANYTLGAVLITLSFIFYKKSAKFARTRVHGRDLWAFMFGGISLEVLILSDHRLIAFKSNDFRGLIRVCLINFIKRRFKIELESSERIKIT